MTQAGAVADVLARVRPAVVINAAAYTAVDAAEAEPDRAHAVNAEGAGNVAEACRRVGARMIQVSTDYVFDGAAGRPYRPDDRPRPLGTYGRTKLAGEREVIRLLGDEAVILRTSWLYSRWGRNFVLTMLRLFEERDEVGVVQDQVGAPTWSRSLAEAIWVAASRPEVRGIHHWTDEGADELVRLRRGHPGRRRWSWDCFGGKCRSGRSTRTSIPPRRNGLPTASSTRP